MSGYRFFTLGLILGGGAMAQQPSFQRAAYPLGSGPASVITADFNGDGKPDVAAINVVSNAFTVLLNNGDGTFKTSSSYAPPTCTPYFIAAGDFVRDGKPDMLVVCGASSALIVYPGNGDGTFGAPISTAAPTDILAFFDVVKPAIADFNGDGFLDVAYIAYNPTSASLVGTVNVILGTGTGKFTNPKAVGTTQGVSLTAADVNMDGKADLIVSQPPGFSAAVLAGVPGKPGPIQILIGKGDGTFTTGASYSMTFAPGPVTVGDLNGDGKPDLVVDGYYDAMAVLTGNGDGTFKQTYSQAVGGGTAGAPVIVDFTGGGTPGVILPAGMCCANQVLFLPANKDGTLQPMIGIQTGVPSPSVVAADFNGDGKVDFGLVSFPVDPGIVDQIYLQHNGSLVGNGSFVTMMNTTVTAPVVSHVNGAGFQTGAPLAAGSIASAFASGGLAAGTDTPSTIPLPTSDQGATVSVKDSSGTSRLTALFFVSAKQINYQVPDATAAGAATVSVNYAGQSYGAQEQIAAVAPGIFQANPATHLISADVLQVHADSSRTTGSASQLSTSGSVVPAPVDLGVSSDQVFLTIYATGIQHAKNVTANIGAVSVPVTFAGPQGGFVGLDQVNIGPLPRSLAGAGQQNVMITADGISANVVNLSFK